MEMKSGLTRRQGLAVGDLPVARALPVWRILPLVLVAALGHAADAGAQELSARAYLDPPTVQAGQPYRLAVELSGVRDIGSVRVPVAPGLASGDDSRLWWFISVNGPEVNGLPPGSVLVTYSSFEAPSPGSYQIGPLRISVDGRTVQTDPVTLVVSGSTGVEVRASVSPSQVNVTDEFELTIEVLGGGRMIHEPVLPDMFAFAVPTGSSGGSDDRYSYTMRATAPGEFEVPPVRVTLADAVFETEPVNLVITDEPSAVQVRATIESKLIWVGGEFALDLEVLGTDDLDEEPVLPETGDFAELLPESRQANPGRVRLSSRRPAATRSYRFRAVREGRFQVGRVRVAVNGRTYVSEPVRVVINAFPFADADPPEGLVLMAIPARQRAYVNEPVIVSFSLLSRGSDLRSEPRTGTIEWPDFEGFRVAELSRRQRGREAQVYIDGHRYNTVPLRRVALFPSTGASGVIGQATLEAQLREPRGFGRARRSESPRYTSVIVASDPVSLEVLPLPAEGRPASFRGHVGKLEVASWVDRTGAEVGDTVTLQVEVSVEGHMKGLPDPEIDFPTGFEVSGPQIRTAIHASSEGLDGTRTYIYRLVARAAGSYEIPAVEMSYFDAESESYGTSRGQPFVITVVPAGNGVR